MVGADRGTEDLASALILLELAQVEKDLVILKMRLLKVEKK